MPATTNQNFESLVIVESPNKIKTISTYLGDKFLVKASVGHIAILPNYKKNTLYGIDTTSWTPIYEIDPEKKKIVKELKSLTKNVKNIYIATDPDREGEAIAYHLVQFLDLNDNYHRIRFNEITKDAILESINNPKKLDNLLVESQMARRILDRIIGFKLSNLMKYKIKNISSIPSAGRVQSIALKLVIDRHNQIKNFAPHHYYKLSIELDNSFLVDYFNPDKKENKEWIELDEYDNIKNTLEQEVILDNIKVSKKTSPFIQPLKQSSLYKKADNKLNMGAKQVQAMAQLLYEQGYITYPRTDSTRISNVFIDKVKQYIVNKYGLELFNDKQVGKTAGQDAHEAIRPTNLDNLEIIEKNIPEAAFKIYKLIYNTTLQAFLKPPIFEITNYKFKMINHNHYFSSHLTKLLFPGYKVLEDKTKEDPPKVYSFEKNQKFQVTKVNFNKHQTQPPAYFTDGNLIEKLDNVGVGRPSTFANTINILKNRNYVETNSKYLIPTEIGLLVHEKLCQGFPKIMNIEYTAKIEDKLDKIAIGEQQKNNLINNFWEKFNQNYQQALTLLEKTKIENITVDKDCPNCNIPLIIRHSKKGNNRFFGCSNFPNCKYLENDPSYKPKRKWKKNFTQTNKTAKIDDKLGNKETKKS